MEPNTPTLLELQRAVYRSLAQGADDADSVPVIPDRMNPAERLSIYRNTFRSVLTKALRLSYPAIHRLVGAEFFEAAARGFIEEQPPQSAYLDEYGADFSEFLEQFPPAVTLSYLPDVARLEWAVNRALHAPDEAPLDVGRLAELKEADRGRVCFTPHPSLALIRADAPADLIWRAVLEQDDAALAAIDLTAGPVWLLVQRSAAGVSVTRMSETAWRFTAGLRAGRPLHLVIDEAPGVEAEALLADHLAAGRFIGFSLGEASVS